MQRMGQTQPFGRNPDAKPVTGTQSDKRRRTAGRYGKDVDRLQRLVEKQWVHRSRHETLDEVDIEDTFKRLRKRLAKGSSNRDYARAVERAFCELSDANLRVVDAADASLRDSGLRFEVANGSLLAVGATDDRYNKPPKPGEMVIAVDGKPVSSYLERRCIAPASSPGARQTLAADHLGQQRRSAGVSARPREVVLRRASGKTYALKLKWKLARDPTGPCVEADKSDPTIGVLRIHRFGCADLQDGRPAFAVQLDNALDDLGGVPHFAVDLRRAANEDLEMAKLAAQRLVTSAPAWIRGRRRESQSFLDVPLGTTNGQVPARPLWGIIGPRCSEHCELVASVLATSPGTTD